jgi:hypothetical protein
MEANRCGQPFLPFANTPEFTRWNDCADGANLLPQTILRMDKQ